MLFVNDSWEMELAEADRTILVNVIERKSVIGKKNNRVGFTVL